MREIKEVFQCDYNGFFIGPAQSDKLEDGTWQIPAGCVTDNPPPAVAGHQRRWDGEKWVHIADGDIASILPPTEPGEETISRRHWDGKKWVKDDAAVI